MSRILSPLARSLAQIGPFESKVYSLESPALPRTDRSGPSSNRWDLPSRRGPYSDRTLAYFHARYMCGRAWRHQIFAPNFAVFLFQMGRPVKIERGFGLRSGFFCCLRNDLGYHPVIKNPILLSFRTLEMQRNGFFRGNFRSMTHKRLNNFTVSP